MSREALRALLDTQESNADSEQIKALEHASVRGIVLAKARENLACPICGGVMEAFNYGGDSGVLLDRCGICKGIWLDGGELEKVLMYVEASDEDLDVEARRLSGRLREIEIREDLLEQRDNRALNAPVVAAVVNRILDSGPSDFPG
jgi:Zn-finger nucleic acid-binding protein